MIKLNINNSKISEKEILKMQKKVSLINENIINKKGLGNEFTGWIDNFEKNEFKKEIKEIKSAMDFLKKNKQIEKLLVIGIGGSYLGAKSGIDFIKGSIISSEKVLFVGMNVSSSYIKQIEEKLKDKKWAICVISKSGTTLETLLTFRHFRQLLEKNVGKKEANESIVVVSNDKSGPLKEMSDKNGYKLFLVPEDIGGRFSVLTPVGIIALEFIGVNIDGLIKGFKKAKEELESSSLKENIAYKYAVTRYLLNKKGYDVEIFATYDEDLIFLSEWLKQLFGESEGKDSKGIFPTSVNYTRDLHSLGQSIQEGKKIFFETTIWVNDNKKVEIKKDEDNLDNLNYLNGKSFNDINKLIFESVFSAHSIEGKLGNISIEMNEKNEESLGYLYYFFFKSVTMSAYLIGVNPFNQPGVEVYKKNINSKLK